MGDVRNAGFRAGILTACLMALSACGAKSADTPSAKTVTPDGNVQPLAPDDKSVATLAVETLAEELNVPMDSITVDTVRAVEWNDASLGCPQPGRAYAQVITPGHKVTLRVDGNLHFVHEANGRAIVCKQSEKKAVRGVSPQKELVWGKQAVEARRDLAKRLGVDEGEIIIAAADLTTFTDASLGCPEPGVEYNERNIDGYVLTLRHGSRNFTYHTDMDRVIPCPAITPD